MKIIYILPNGTVKSGGNWVTATRLAEGLKKRKNLVDMIEVKDVTKEILQKYDLIHAFHAFKSLTKIKHLTVDMDKSMVVSFTGTDLNQLQEIKENKDKIIDLLNKTQSIVVFHDEDRKELIKEGILCDKLKVIPQTASPMTIGDREKQKTDHNSEYKDTITFLLAAGIRRVKAPLEVVEMMSILFEKVENIRLIIIGPILEKDLGEKFKEAIDGKAWIKYLGEVLHEEAQELILESDIIINGSISEGMSNTLLEAQQMGKAILARDISGNRSIVSHGVDGFLFKDKKEFEYYATELVKDSKLRNKIGLSALKSKKNYDLEDEINMYEMAYKA